jgi:hypothetical protein
MRRAIETAPRNRNVIIIEDDASGTSDVAHWSPDAGQWVGKGGEASKIMPTHWRPVLQDRSLPQEQDQSLLQEDEGTDRIDKDRTALDLLLGNPFAPREIACDPAASEAECRISSSRSQRGRVRRRFTTSSIVAIAAAALIGAYFRFEVVASLARYANLQEISGITAIGEQLVGRATELLRLGPVRAYLRALKEQAGADQGSVLVRKAPVAPALEARQSSGKEARQEILAKDPAEARYAVDGLNPKLRTAAATAAQSFDQGNERTATLVQDDDAAPRQALTANTAQHREALEEEHARSDAPASEPRAARNEIETKVVLSSKAADELAQFKHAAMAATAELEQSLQEERDRGAVLMSELATARWGFETAKVALLSKAADELAQLKKAATAELEQSLQEERDRSTALTTELATAHREFETKMSLLSKARDETVQLREAAEAKVAELGQSLQQERDKAAALARDLESARHVIEARTTLDRTANSPIGQTKPAAAKQPAAAETKDNPPVIRLMARASTLLGQDNISAARIVLKRAVETGSAEASFALAETYDPRVLSRWGAYRTRGDVSKARELYAKAWLEAFRRRDIESTRCVNDR